MWHKRYPSISALIALGICLRAGATLLHDGQRTPPPLQSTCGSAEECYALGYRLPLRDADDYALLLLPGISDQTASAIRRANKEICSHALVLPDKEQWRAFMEAKGVGPALAHKLDAHIEISPLRTCIASEGAPAK